MFKRKIEFGSSYTMERWQLVLLSIIISIATSFILKWFFGVIIKNRDIFLLLCIFSSIIISIFLICAGATMEKPDIDFVPSKKYFIEKYSEGTYRVICEKFGILYEASHILDLKKYYKTPE